MSDRYYASFHIRKKDLEADSELKESIENYFGYEGEEKDGVVTFEDDQASYGQFLDIEDKCQSLNVPFDRYSSGYYENTAYTIHFRPGKETVCIESDEQGNDLVILDEIVKIQEADDAQLRTMLDALVEKYHPVPLAMIA